MKHLGLLLSLYLLATAFCGASSGAGAEELINLPTRPGVIQPFWLVMPEGKPVASVILFPGGEGNLGSSSGRPLRNNNFLVRTRGRFAAEGFLVAVVDVPSDHPEGLGEFRNTEGHASDIAAVIAYLRQKAPVPVWLVGTSRGTTSAANAAARLKPPEVADGLVLTSSITVSSRRVAALPDSVDLRAIAIPTLMVHNREDACVVCPFSAAQAILDRFARAPRRELIAFEGGNPPKSDPCEAMSRHGFLGLEPQVVAAIGRWIKGG